MKTASRIILTFIMLAFFTGMNFAQVASTTTPAKTATKQTTQEPGKSVDNNKNGTCDKHESKANCASGKNYVDKNADGKCDNCGSTGKCSGSGCGTGCGKSQGKGDCGGKGQGTGNGCGKGQGTGSGCSKPCGTPTTEPKK